MSTYLVKRRDVEAVTSTSLNLTHCKERAMSESHSTAPVEYRPIAGFPGYRVGSDGSVWSSRERGRGAGKTKAWSPMKICYSCHGYATICMMADGKARSRRVARVVLEAFIGPCPTGMQACHFPDRNKRNNSISNLRWGTAQENADDRDVHQTTARGERAGTAKLTEEKVREIRRLFDAGDNRAEIGRKFGITMRSVFFIGTRAQWKHVM